ncbi:MAG: hypothetical protein QNK36_19405 [Colwellia sp.]|nr:hypothetical protein [Colwellia sp.]
MLRPPLYLNKSINITGFMFIVFPILYLIIGYDLIPLFNINERLWNSLSRQAIIFAFFGVILLIGQYLRGAFLPSSSSNGSRDREYASRLEQLVFRLEKNQKNQQPYEDISKLLHEFELKLTQQIGDTKTDITLEENEKIFERVITGFESNINENLVKSFSDKYSEQISQQEQSRSLFAIYESTSKRIENALIDLERRAKLSLFIGCITTLAAVGGLAYIVFTNEHDFLNATSAINHYVPKISFVILIEVFAFFFLRLYKESLSDIKYYQNESTNIDSKIMALKAAVLTKKDSSMTSVIKNLTETDRNFILKKGESTVELEKAKHEKASFNEAVTALSKLLGKVKVPIEKSDGK